MQNSSKYDFLLIIKNLADNFDSNDFECLRDNTEQFISFSISMNKNVKKENLKGNRKDHQNLDNFRYMHSSLSDLVDNLLDNSHKKKWEDCKCTLEYKKF